MKKRRTLTRKDLAALLPPGSDLPSRLIESLGEEQALQVSRKLRGMPNTAHRQVYAQKSICNKVEFDEHVDWLAKHPPYEEILDDDELRETPTEDIRARHREIARREARIAELNGETSGFELLRNALGPERAFTLAKKVVLTLTSISPTRRINAILMGASRARNPAAYVAKSIANEQARHANQKKAKR